MLRKSFVHCSLGGGLCLRPDWPGPGLGLGGEEEGDQERQEPETEDNEPSLSGERIFNYEIKKSIENCATTHLASTRKKPVQPPQASTALLRPPTRRLFRMSLVNRNP